MPDILPSSSSSITINERPLVTFALFAYNQERFIREAVEGALSQKYSPLEIILSDDCSSDNTYLIIGEIVRKYRGPHKLKTRVNAVNKGLIGHVNEVLSESSGDYIVLAAGDDISLPDRVSAVMKAFGDSKSIYGVYTNVKYIDRDGNKMGVGGANLFVRRRYNLEDYLTRNDCPMVGCSSAIRKEVFKVFGPINPQVSAEDNTLLLRVLLLGEQVHIPDVLVKYRLHPDNMSRIAGNHFQAWQEFVNKSTRFTQKHKYLFDQHSSDIDLACQLNLLTSSSEKQLRQYVTNESGKNRITTDYLNQSKRYRYYYKYIIFDSRFSIRVKFINFLLIFGLPGVKLLIFVQRYLKLSRSVVRGCKQLLNLKLFILKRDTQRKHCQG